MRKYMLPVLCISLSTLYGQSISSSVIALAGGLEKTPSGLTLSWTLGEPIVDPVRTTDVILTQGFQQPTLTMNTGFIQSGLEYEVSIFPNPATDELSLQTDYEGELTFQLVSVTGQNLRQGSWRSNHNIEIHSLTAGTYILFVGTKHQLIRSEIILKGK